jgi:hypothetical protein
MIKSSATANPVLSALFQKFRQNMGSFVGMQLAPVFNTGEQSAKYYVFGDENERDIPDLKGRAPSSPYPRTSITLSDDSFDCVNRGIEIPVDDNERAKYADAFAADAAAMRRAALIVSINHEKRVKTLATSGAVTSSSPSTKWDAASGSDPLGDVDTAREAIYTATGGEANVMIINRAVYNVLREHAAILDKYKHTQPGIITSELLANVFGVQRLIVAGALENTANEGQTATPAQIWGDSVILAIASNSPDLESPNFMRTFNWSDRSGPNGVLVETYREDAVESDIHRAKQHTDEKITGASLGYHLSDVLT